MSAELIRARDLSVSHPGADRPVLSHIDMHIAPAEIVTVTSVPPPSESGGPNLIAYALNSSGAVGTETYRRMNPLRWSRWQDACLQYRNQDAAQLAFLSNGGPQRDPDNLDPDGDGYACWWDPAPIRQAAAQR